MLEANQQNTIGKSYIIQRLSKYITQEDSGEVQNNGRKDH